MDEIRMKLKNQIADAADNVLYTYAAHWIIVNRLKSRQTSVKITQIILTALSTGGFLASVIAGIPWLSWVGGFTSATALGLNLYSLNFNLPSDIKNHTDAANELWEVREDYKAIITDFDDMTKEEIRSKRDELKQAVSRINKVYPGTDKKSFEEVQKSICNYMFEAGESANDLNLKDE